jgi:hypothetical protein
LVSLLLRGSGFDGVETTEATPMAVSPRATENDWACVPEGLAAAALATRGRPFLDGALWGYAPSFLDGDAFADLKDTDGGGRERVWRAAATVAVSAAAGLGVGAAIVVAARGRVPTEKSESVGPSEPRASGGAFGDALAAGKKKRGARGKKRGSREPPARVFLSRPTTVRRRRRRTTSRRRRSRRWSRRLLLRRERARPTKNGRKNPR